MYCSAHYLDIRASCTGDHYTPRYRAAVLHRPLRSLTASRRSNPRFTAKHPIPRSNAGFLFPHVPMTRAARPRSIHRPSRSVP
jgi:hypothetical protein